MRLYLVRAIVGGSLVVVLISCSTLMLLAADNRPKTPQRLQSIIERAPVKPKENQFPGEAVHYAAILINVESQEYQLSIDFADGSRAFAHNVKPETVMMVQSAFAHPDKLGVIAYYRVDEKAIDFLMVFSRNSETQRE